LEKHTSHQKKMNRAEAEAFVEITRTIFAPIYPTIAEQIVERCGITRGVCIDLGSGPADLAVAFAKHTGMKVYALDHSPHMNRVARQNIAERGETGLVIPVLGNVHEIPFGDDFADLVISRGSIFFWDDLSAVYREVVRVLKPGGRGYIGGGFGTAHLQREITEKMKSYAGWEKKVRKRLGKENIRKMKEMLSGITFCPPTFIEDETGFWIMISKP